MKELRVDVAQFTGCNYRPERVLGTGYFTDDHNGRHFTLGAWRPRLGLQRWYDQFTNVVLGFVEFTGVDEEEHTVTITEASDAASAEAYSDGTESEKKIAISMSKDAPEPTVPPELVVARNRLLEDCLRSIKQVRMDAERDRAEQVRKALKVEIEKERMRARERADQQRKALQLEVEEEEK